MFIIYDTPRKHPRVSAVEIQYLAVYGMAAKKKQVGS